ncbi:MULTISPECIES: GNAT family N-acetyltransferase [unclassified Streptomyces]|uniref:GNAT family N-acetyltransferase n=1 Tax=unclassified Streptomyces TaxID=2593676 RepID=UPI0038231AFF
MTEPETNAPETEPPGARASGTSPREARGSGTSLPGASTSEENAPRPGAPGTLIRVAVHGDDAGLGVLDRVTWSTLHAVVPAPAPPYGPFFDDRHLPEDYLVAVRGGTLVGYVRVAQPIPLPSHAHVLQIQGLVVAESARGEGVARGLLRAAMDRARERGATRLTLRVLGHNAPARALYASEGFAVEGVLTGEFLIGGRYVDDVCMGRSLVD